MKRKFKRPSFAFVLRGRKGKDGLQALAVRIIFNRKSKFWFLGIRGMASEWDKSRQRWRKNRKDYSTENVILAQIETRALEMVRAVEADNGGFFEVTEWEARFFDVGEAPTLSEWLAEVEADLERGGSLGNAAAYYTCRCAVAAFDGRVRLDGITVEWLDRWAAWLVDVRGCKGNTVYMYLRTLRAGFNRAVRAKKVVEAASPFVDFPITKWKEKTAKRALDLETLRRLRGVDVADIPMGEYARDMFLLSFYLRGISLTDLARLRWSDVVDGRVRYKRQKTGGGLSIPLIDPARAIAERWRLGAWLAPILGAMHQTELQKRYRIKRQGKIINAGLRAIAERLGVAGFTLYAARHTYATLLKKNGASVELISDALGHGDIRTTQIYLDSFDEGAVDGADLGVFGLLEK